MQLYAIGLEHSTIRLCELKRVDQTLMWVPLSYRDEVDMFEEVRSHYKEARWYTNYRKGGDTNLNRAMRVAQLSNLPFINDMCDEGKPYREGDL